MDGAPRGAGHGERPAGACGDDPAREREGGATDAGRQRFAPDPARIAAGWTPRFAAGPDRIDEMTRLYQELGFEVVADPVRPEDAEDDCRDCRLLTLARFRFIYTRAAAGDSAKPEARATLAGDPPAPRRGLDAQED